jgi:citrate synthase
MASDKTVKLTDEANGKQAELSILTPTYGNSVVDLRGLTASTGYFTHDPGYTSTSACRSAITFIDGDEGILLYRGYPIEQLAEKSNFLEVCYLLMFGDLPNEQQWEEFRSTIYSHTMIHEGLRTIIQGYRRGAHPMGMMVGLVGALSSFYHDALDVNDPEHRLLCAYRLIAKMPTIGADTYKFAIGQPFMHPDNSYDFVANFMRMMFGVPAEKFEVDPVAERALELMMILHADHEQNASTSTVRLAGSSGANPFAAVAAGIATLWGPAHGGANEAVIHMLRQIDTASDIPKFVERAKDKDDPSRLMGFGHRVYKNFDPRAKIIRQACHDLLDQLGDAGENQPMFEIALELEQIARKDEFFIERNLYPNVDFYSGIILSALGIPLNMFTVMFAIARTVGWISQWNEMMGDEDFKIGRPRQLYIGAAERNYVDMGQR